MQTRDIRTSAGLRGLWLNPGPVSTSIDTVLSHMLALTHPDTILRQAVLEELQRRTKFKDVVIRALGLQERGLDQEGTCTLRFVVLEQGPQHPRHDTYVTHSEQ